MLPVVRSNGKPPIPSLVFSVAGLLVIIWVFARTRNIDLANLAVGSWFLVIGLGIETAVIQFRVARLERENEALRRLLNKSERVNEQPE